MRREFTSINFLDPAKAEQNMARLEQQLAPTLVAPLASLLGHSPDPDDALNLLERFVESAPADVLADLARYPTALTYLVAIFGYSGYLAESLLAEPGLTAQFARDRNFTKLKSKEDLMQDYARFATTSPDHWLSAQLARFKRRNYLRIVLKDVLGLSTLGETTFELSTLADVILSNTLTFCFQELEKRYGHPQYRDAQGRIVPSGFSIISLGKLGGNELNYSSDIDLLFLYGQDGETSGGSEPDSAVSNKEFFVRLAHAVTRSITQPTHQGEVFRVDLRLRPEGEQGDLAISLNSATEYYKHRARDWELQMLIKARHSAGDVRLTREFLRRVETYVYGSPSDFEAVESVLWARDRISKKLRESRGEALDVKLHRGGIRDIEFLTQCLQRLRGGQDPWVRSGGTLFALRKLNDKGWLSDSDFAALTSCYEFFRKLEHRIQLEMGKQTHRLPKDPAALERLARRVGADSDSAKVSGTALVSEVRRRFARVDEIYQRLIHPPAAAGAGGEFRLEPVAAGIEEHAHSYEAMLSFLDVHAAELAALVRQLSPPERARRNVTKFLAALLGSSERFRMASREPARIRQALQVVAASDYLSDLLIYHPEEVAELGAPEIETQPGAAQIEMDLEAPAQFEPFAWAGEENLDFREKMALLRRDYRSRVVALAGGDLIRGVEIWSALARRGAESALWIAAQSLHSDLKARAQEIPFVVLGLGRLGLNEFDLGSDADLVFVVTGGAAREEIPRWTRLAEKTIEVLSSYTRDGTVFVVDTRLRPRGQEGELVVTEDTLVAYLAETAQVWETLTYLKANPVAGNRAAAERLVSRVVQTCLERSAHFPDLEGELHRMRRRLETEVIVPPSNTKTVSGGYYDVDFAVSYLHLKRRLAMAPGSNAPERIWTLLAANALREDDARALTEGATFLRTLDHAIRLCTGRPSEGLPEHVGHAEAVENLAHRWGMVKTGLTLAERLREIQQQVRYVYRRLVESE